MFTPVVLRHFGMEPSVGGRALAVIDAVLIRLLAVAQVLGAVILMLFTYGLGFLPPPPTRNGAMRTRPQWTWTVAYAIAAAGYLGVTAVAEAAAATSPQQADRVDAPIARRAGIHDAASGDPPGAGRRPAPPDVGSDGSTS